MSEQAPLAFLIGPNAPASRALGQTLGRSGLRVEEFGSAEEFLGRPVPGEPACAVLDVDLPGLSGLDLQQLMADRAPALRFVFVTASRDAAAAVRALKAGAVDYLFTPVADADLLAAVGRAVGQSAAAARAAADLVEFRRRVATLSVREREVMDLVVRGRLNKQIADALGLSLVTVKQHRGRVMRKMNAHSLAALVRMAGLAADAPPAAGG